MTRQYADFCRALPHKSSGDKVIIWLSVLASVIIMLIVAITVTILVSVRPAKAHDGWINNGGFKNKNNEWCCGDYDCKAYKTAQSGAQGWMLDGELVPYDEAMPVAPLDGMVTVCRRPDGTRRCVFGLKPGL